MLVPPQDCTGSELLNYEIKKKNLNFWYFLNFPTTIKDHKYQENKYLYFWPKDKTAGGKSSFE